MELKDENKGGKEMKKSNKLNSYNRLTKQEIAELRKISASESVKRGIALIAEVAKWKK